MVTKNNFNFSFDETINAKILEEYFALVESEGWEKSKSDNEKYQIFTRKHKTSPLKLIKVVTECDCAMEPLIDLLHTQMVER